MSGTRPDFCGLISSGSKASAAYVPAAFLNGPQRTFPRTGVLTPTREVVPFPTGSTAHESSVSIQPATPDSGAVGFIGTSEWQARRALVPQVHESRHQARLVRRVQFRQDHCRVVPVHAFSSDCSTDNEGLTTLKGSNPPIGLSFKARGNSSA